MTGDAEWSRSAQDLLAALDSRRDGLSATAAAERLRRDGPNAVKSEGGVSPITLLLRQFESPLVLILLFAALIAGAVREWFEAAIILAIVFGSTALGFAQEYRASAAVGAPTSPRGRPRTGAARSRNTASRAR
jgi:Mg2+-importing ATPase